MHTRKKLSLVMLAALAVAVVPFVASGSRPATAQDRQVSLTPSSGLAAGQLTTVSWSGFTPGPVSIYQCTAGAVVWSQCAEATYVKGTTGPDGTGSAQFPVWRGAIPTPPNVVGGSNFPIFCNATSPCEVVVTECGFDVDGDHAARASIGFAPGGANPSATTTAPFNTTTTSLPDIPPVEADPIVTAYSASTHLLMSDMQIKARQEPLALNLDLLAQSSPNANDQFVNGAAEMTITALDLTGEELAALEEQQRDVTRVPVAASALAVGLQLRVNGIEIEKFRLSADTLAQGYKGTLSSFNDEPIVRDNDGCSIQMNNRRYPVSSYRGDVSAANVFFTTWLDSQAPSWDLGVDENLPVEDSQVYGRPSAENLSEFVAFGDLSIDHATNSGAGRWGFVDRSYARAFGLVEVALQNAAGQFVQPTDEAVTAAIADGYAPGTFFFPKVDSTVAEAYPMPIVYYAVVQTNLTDTFTQENADDLKTFLSYLTSDEGQARAAELGFVPMPAELRAEAAASIATIGSTGGESPPPANNPSSPPSGSGSFSSGASSSSPSSLSGSTSRALAASGLGAIGETITLTDVSSEDEDSGPLDFIQRVLTNPATLIALPVLAALGLAAIAIGQVMKRSRAAQVSAGG